MRGANLAEALAPRTPDREKENMGNPYDNPDLLSHSKFDKNGYLILDEPAMPATPAPTKTYEAELAAAQDRITGLKEVLASMRNQMNDVLQAKGDAERAYLEARQEALETKSLIGNLTKANGERVDTLEEALLQSEVQLTRINGELVAARKAAADAEADATEARREAKASLKAYGELLLFRRSSTADQRLLEDAEAELLKAESKTGESMRAVNEIVSRYRRSG